MARLNMLLSAVLVLCALALVHAQQRSRQLFIDLETAKARTVQLETRWNELQVEQHQFARNARIDAKARSELAMRGVAPDRMLLLTMHGNEPRFAQAPDPAPLAVPARVTPTGAVAPAGPIVVRGVR